MGGAAVDVAPAIDPDDQCFDDTPDDDDGEAVATGDDDDAVATGDDDDASAPDASAPNADDEAVNDDRCFDCGASCAADRWVSMNHGTIICLTCAGTHRGLGVAVSFVRSEKLDGLTDDERSVLARSGNAAFAAFLAEHGLPRAAWLSLEPVGLRYFTPAADLYRRRLAGDEAATLQHVDPPAELVRRLSAASIRSSSAAPPKWTPDKAVDGCQLCKRRFSTFFRRHHCRACGRCVCDSCSPRPCWRDGARTCKLCSPPPARVIPGLMPGP